MQKVEERIKIISNVFIKNIKIQIEHINESTFNEEVKNNLSMAGELLINSINMFKRDETLASISLLRNVYEMTLKGVVLDKSKEICDAYKIIQKSGSHNKDSSSNIRRFISKNFKEYFYIIENNDILNKIYGKGILTYLYDKLCNFSHASPIMELLYKMEKEEIIVRQVICIFIVCAMVVFYMDATSVKMNKLDISETTGLLYMLIIIYTFSDWNENKDEFNKLKKYESIIDLSIDLNKIYYNKENELIYGITNDIKESLKEIENLSVEESIEVERKINERLKKYCGKINYKKFIALIPKIKV